MEPNPLWLLVGIVFFCLFFATACYSIYVIATGSANILFNRYILFRYRLNTQQKNTLEYKVAFYRNLKPSLKRKFECNVDYFIKDKTFQGKEGVIVRDEMKLMIAAAATQISFGHFPTIYEHFNKIIVYPDKYYSGYSQAYHVGEVQSNGVIKLSWKAFTEGLQIKDDGIHVGYHEMAHALKIEDVTLHDTEHCFMDKNVMHELHVFSQHRIKHNIHSELLRAYAFTNSEEFFAVSIEYFFENPLALKKYEPEVFEYLKKILKLDPLNLKNPVL